MSNATEATVRATAVAEFLSQYAFACSSEAVLQLAVQEALKAGGVPAERERPLSSRDRIDLYLPDDRIGIECKIDGSLAAVIGQLLRYAESPAIEALILVTSRSRHRAIPVELGGKPVFVVLTRAF